MGEFRELLLKKFDNEGAQFLLELHAYKRGLDAMFSAFAGAAREGADFKTALRLIGEWFDEEFKPIIEKANVYLDTPADTFIKPGDNLSHKKWPMPPTKGFGHGSSDV